HNVVDILKKVSEPQCINSRQEVREEQSDCSSDDEARGLAFDDSEEERTMAINEGFEEVDKPPEGSSRRVVSGYKRRVDFEKCDDEYISDDLGSSDPDDSDKESGPKYEKFRKEQLNKDYE
ncbi:hypothetical protein A2U01_0043109, partial [Trifolium medium]|nr:hypothetical protein [Trifolium medium]